MNKKLIICLWVLSAGAMAQEQIVTRDFSTTESKKNDFGLSFNLDAEKKLTSRMSLNFEGELRTQDNSSKVDRWTAGLGLQYKIYQTLDKRFNLKAGLGINYTRLQTLTEKSNFDKLSEHYDDEGNFNGYTERIGYRNTDSYWRDRIRTSMSLSATFSPSRRWSFSIKETLQYNRYCSTDSIHRTRTSTTYYKWREFGTKIGNLEEYGYKWAEMTDADGNTETMYYYDANVYEPNNRGNRIYEKDEPDKTTPFTEVDMKSPRKAADKWVLRSKLTVAYDIKSLPLTPYASVDYGFGLNYTTHKWKIFAGSEYTINKKNKLNLFYRFSHENDADEPNGHLVGIGYKLKF